MFQRLRRRATLSAMGFYCEKVFPRVMDLAMRRKSMVPARQRVCTQLSGDVVEIGFGTGLNLPHLPPSVTSLRAVDPLALGRSLARERLASSTVPVEFIGLDGQSLPLDDASVDAALSTWTLCSTPDPVAAVREIRRVLRPGGVLRFVEHGRSPDARTLRWQRRLNPVQQRVACGCHLDRDIPLILAAGGLQVLELDTYYMEKEPKVFGWTFEGSAQAA